MSIYISWKVESSGKIKAILTPWVNHKLQIIYIYFTDFKCTLFYFNIHVVFS